MVEHNMSVVANISDTITVLSHGDVIANGPYEQVSKDPKVMEAYMGASQNELEEIQIGDSASQTTRQERRFSSH